MWFDQNGISGKNSLQTKAMSAPDRYSLTVSKSLGAVQHYPLAPLGAVLLPCCIDKIAQNQDDISSVHAKRCYRKSIVHTNPPPTEAPA